MIEDKVFMKAVLTDIDTLLEITNDARNYIRSQGFEQWQNGYPDKEVLKNDIIKGNLFVAKKNNIILGFAVIEYGNDIYYQTIYEGKWLTNAIKYPSLHRFAIKNGYRNEHIATFLYDNLEDYARKKNYKCIRMDTHMQNLPMNSFIQKKGFSYCGKLKIHNEIKYNAYEKVLK